MASSVFQINRQAEYRKAGPEDLIEMLPVPKGHPLFILKKILEILVCGIINHEFIHLSGPTGTAKSSLLEALHRVPKNFHIICRSLGFPVLPIKIYPIEIFKLSLHEREKLVKKEYPDYGSGIWAIRLLEFIDQCIEKNDYPVSKLLVA